MMQYQRLARSSKSNFSLASTFISSADYYRSKNDFDSALFFCKQADTILLKLQIKRRLAANYRMMGRLYREKEKDHTSSLINLGEAEECLKRREIDHQLVTLEQKALQSMMNPHFIFNTLGSIQNYLLQNKSGEAGLYLSQFARLIRLNISSINSALISLEEEVNRLRIYLDLEKFRMENKFEYLIEIDHGIEEDEVYIPSMIIQPFVENSIWHGISALEDKGLIKIFFSMHSSKALSIIIEDNGIGIKQSVRYAPNNESHLHLSMEVIRKRLEIIGKKMKVDTSMDISETSPGSPNPGTRVALVVPFIYGETEG